MIYQDYRLLYYYNRFGNSSQLIWSTYMSSSSSDTCYGTRNSCSSTSVTSCNHYEDITVESSKYHMTVNLYYCNV